MIFPIRSFAMFALAFSLLSSPAVAQEADTQQLLDRIERMDRDIKALNLRVYRGESAVNPAEGGQELSGPLGARLSIRINELESQLRQMTGQLEETAYRISQLNSRLDKLVADVDYRLTSLEGGNPSARPDLGNTRNVQGQVSTEPLKPQAPTAPSQKGVLGTLPGTSLNAPAKPADEAGQQAQPNVSPEEAYQGARRLLMSGDYTGADQAFQSFIGANPEHELTGNARYWLGETYYVQGNFARAAQVFLEGYQKDSQGAKAPDSLLKLGMSLRRIDKVKEACATFGKLRADFPQMPAHLSKTLERERAEAQCS